MGIKQTIQKIKEYLEAENQEVVENFTDIKTNDGLILSYDAPELVAGTEIFVVDENGRTPAPSGEYLVDGLKITIVDGVVEAVEAVEEPEPETEVEVPVEPVAEMAEETNNIDALVEKINKLEADYTALLDAVTKMADTINKQNFKEEVKVDAKEVKLHLGKRIEKVEIESKKNPLLAFAKNA